MTVGSGKRAQSPELSKPERTAAIQATRHWVQRLARTLKSCRLYATANPIIERARLKLAEELHRLLEEHGPLTLSVRADDLVCEGTSLYPARSRDDNLALPFYRDGIRKIFFTPGIDPDEVNLLVNVILKVTGPDASEDDLVTLLWQAQLAHIEIEYVPAEAVPGNEHAGSSAPDGGSAGGGFGASGDGDGDGGGTGSHGAGGGGGHGGSGGAMGRGGSGRGGSAGAGPSGGAGASGGAAGWGSNMVDDGAPSLLAAGAAHTHGADSDTSGEATGDAGSPGPADRASGSFGAARSDRGAQASASGEQGLPWPGLAANVELSTAGEEASSETAEPAAGRSDDWRVDPRTTDAESALHDLELQSAAHLQEFIQRLEAERVVSPVTVAIELARAYLTGAERAEDRGALVRFLPAVVKHAVADAMWTEAGVALEMLEQIHGPGWSLDPLAEELCHPRLLAVTTATLDAMDFDRVDALVACAQRLGDWTVDLLGQVLAEAGESRHRRRLIEPIVAECRTCPERLAPWLGDPRPTVVRDTVHILGQIGGDAIAGMLRAVVTHPSTEVREEVRAALETVSLPVAQPLLLDLLDDADTPGFCAIVRRLGQARDPQVTKLLVAYLTHAQFEQQPIEERRAVYAAVVTAGGDDVLPELEAELRASRGSDRAQDHHRQAIANCIVQIGTPAAKQVLQRGTMSRRPAIRQTCQAMLARFGRS